MKDRKRYLIERAITAVLLIGPIYSAAWYGDDHRVLMPWCIVFAFVWIMVWFLGVVIYLYSTRKKVQGRG